MRRDQVAIDELIRMRQQRGTVGVAGAGVGVDVQAHADGAQQDNREKYRDKCHCTKIKLPWR